MGIQGKEEKQSSSSLQSSVIGLRDKHHKEIESLSLVSQPIKTFKFFILAVLKCLRQQLVYFSSKRSWLLLISILAAGSGILIRTVSEPDKEYFLELYHYLQFGVWWLALGIASSIGLGSGLHTFVLYLGPHIALFTMKSVQCGRVDIKSAPYDTIQFRRGPSWLDRDCSEYGTSLHTSPGSRVPLSSILHQVQLEVILWGIGTALGELPPYFISRAAYLSGRKLEVMENVETPSKDEGGVIENHLNQMKQWLLLHSEHLNFLTILALAWFQILCLILLVSCVVNLVFRFGNFFTATLIGKAIIKTHIQSCFIISVCNNQLLDLIENRLVWVLSLVPGVSSVLPSLIANLHFLREKYMEASPLVPSNVTGKKWNLSLASIWNAVVLLILVNFLAKIINATAQGFMKEQQEKELAELENSSG